MQRELEPGRVIGAHPQTHAVAPQGGRIEPERCPARAGSRTPELLAAGLDRHLRLAARLRAHPQRHRLRIGRDTERRAAQQEVPRLGDEHRSVRSAREAYRCSDVEDEAARGRLGAPGSRDIDAVSERHDRVEHQRHDAPADRRRRQGIAAPGQSRRDACRAPRGARRSSRRRAGPRVDAGCEPRRSRSAPSPAASRPSTRASCCRGSPRSGAPARRHARRPSPGRSASSP